jgi:ribosomal-protein-alanine N-acetyltransferase
MTAALRLVPWTEGAILASVHGAAAAQAVALLTEHPRSFPWGCHIARVGAQTVGIGAFKGPPDAEGTVEIAYMTLPPLEGQGHARATIRVLVDIARSSGAAVVIAHTAPAMNPSARALAANGFVQADAFVDPEDGPVWYWELPLGRSLAPAATPA